MRLSSRARVRRQRSRSSRCRLRVRVRSLRHADHHWSGQSPRLAEDRRRPRRQLHLQRFAGVRRAGDAAESARERRANARSQRSRQCALDQSGWLGHDLHEQGGRRHRHAHRDGADGGRGARRRHGADYRGRRRHGAMSEHRRHGWQHRAHTRRHGRSSSGGDGATGPPRSRRDAAEASRSRPDHRRRRGSAGGWRARCAASACWLAVDAWRCQSTPRPRSSLHRNTRASASLRPGPMSPRSARDATSTSRTSPFPACSTAA